MATRSTPNAAHRLAATRLWWGVALAAAGCHSGPDAAGTPAPALPVVVALDAAESAAATPGSTASAAALAPSPSDGAAHCDGGGCTIHRVTPQVQALVAATPPSRVGVAGLVLEAREIVTFDDTSSTDDISTIRLLPGTKYLTLGDHPREAIDLGALADLRGLLRLDLSQSAIQSLAPLAGLPLVTLRMLNDTGITDFKPLSSLTSLKVLDLSNCGLTSLEPLAGLVALEELDVSGNRQLASLAGIESLRNLKELELTFTAIRDLAPLARLPALEKVRLYGFGFGAVPDLSGVKNLRDLNLGHNDLVDLGPLRKMTGLRRLVLMQNAKLENLAPLASLPQLAELDLQSTAVKSLAPLAKLPALSHLRLNGTAVKSLAPLASVKTLRTLDIAQDFGHEAEIEALKKALPQLQVMRW